MHDPPHEPAPASEPNVDHDAGETKGLGAPGRIAGAVRTEWSDMLPLVEETLTVGKRRVVTGSLRVTSRTEAFEEHVDIELERKVVEVTHVPIERIVTDVPDVRTEGDTTIVPVVEERFLIVKQLFLKEELHIRHRLEQTTTREVVELRRQHAAVERLDADGRIIEPHSPDRASATRSYGHRP